MSERPSRAVPPDGTLPAVVRGAALIGLAVVVGLILLAQVEDDPGRVNPASRPTRTTTTTTAPAPTTTAPAGPARIPAELPIIVLNAGGPNGAAGALSAQLREQGYTDQLEANDWPGKSVAGTVVLCRSGLGREAAALATDLGGVPVDDFPNPAPPNSDGADCVVAVGTGASR
ncbi:MAG: LytR C-terminal domain-containing protein [Actinomycetota bacterium]